MQGCLLSPGDKAQGLLTLLPGAQTASLPGLLFLSSIAHSKARSSQGPPKPRGLCWTGSKDQGAGWKGLHLSNIPITSQALANPSKKNLNSVQSSPCLLPFKLPLLPGRKPEEKTCYRPTGGSPFPISPSILGSSSLAFLWHSITHRHSSGLRVNCTSKHFQCCLSLGEE